GAGAESEEGARSTSAGGLRFGGEVAGGAMRADLNCVERRLRLGTAGLSLETAGPEAAAAGRVDWRGNVAFQDDAFPATLHRWVRDGNRRQKRRRVGMPRRTVELSRGGHLDDLAEVTDGDPVRAVLNDCRGVGDDQ